MLIVRVKILPPRAKGWFLFLFPFGDVAFCSTEVRLASLAPVHHVPCLNGKRMVGD